MNLKKSYKEQYGCERITTKRNSPLCYLETDMLKLSDAQSYTYTEQGKEFALVVLYGTCKVEGEGFCFEKVGKRASVFDGVAECAYVGLNTTFTVTGVGGDVKICVCKAPADRFFPARYVPTNQVTSKNLGKGAYERVAAFNLSEAVEANLLYIGEFWVNDGNWASFPPHKHDVDNMPTEGFLDEIYYYEFDRPEGFGVQMVYSKDGDLDEAYRVKNGDFVEIPKGYHPFSVAPHYKNYCLWIMAGRDRGIFCTTDPDHKWTIHAN